MSDPKRDPALREILDSYDVPALSAGFADRVMVAAAAPRTPLPDAVPARRDRRGRWMRGHRVVIGVMAFGLMSAAAAATAIFGDVARNMPVIGPIIASVAPARPAQPVRKAAIAAPKPEEGEAPGLADAQLPETPPLSIVERHEIHRAMRREFVAERIADGLARRDERREALGLPPRPPRPAEVLPVLRRIPPADRAAVIERVREIRQEQRAAAAAGGLPDRTIVAPELDAALAPRADAVAPPVSGVQLPDVPADGAPVVADAPRGEARLTPERIEQLRRLRILREIQRRREMRRQRLQQQ